MEKTLVQVNNLKMYFPVTSGILLQRKTADIKAVNDVSLGIIKGETLGLVGESGCGKTTLGKCILQLYRPTAGEILYEGSDLCKMPGKQLRPLRQKLR